MQFSLLLEPEESRDGVLDVIRELRQNAPCQNCRLSLLHPQNRGFTYRGSPEAKIAVLDIAPRAEEMAMGSSLVGKTGAEFGKWMRYLNLDPNKDLFMTQVVQCAPPQKTDSKGKSEQRVPLQDEIAACWFPRTLRVLQALPYLECVITLGYDAAGALLGGDPGPKSHEGRWFVSSLLPRIPVFCLDHPTAFLPAYKAGKKGLQYATPEKKGRMKSVLDCFRREYLQTRKVVVIGADTFGSHLSD